MKVNKTEIIESIKKLNKEKPLMEGAEIQRATLPADADALEQHQEALKQNAERRNPDNYDKEVKELIQETASEESRYSHFDVVDRKDLAKRINEAKEKGLDFKVSKSTKEGFRYDLKVLKEDFMKKEAGDPEVNKDAFNKATDVQASSPTTGLGEDFTPSVTIEGKRLAYDLANWISDHEGDVVEDVKRYLLDCGYENEEVEALFETGDFILEGTEKCPECGKNPCECEKHLDEKCGDEELDEELKVFTSNLDNFHPSERCKDFWNEIKEAHKEEDLEYALETLYPDGISDTALDDMLCHEEDWVRDLIDLPLQDSESEVEEEPEVIDEFDDEEVEPLDNDFEIESEEDIEPVEYEESEEEFVDDEEVEPQEEKQEESLKEDVEDEDVEPLEIEETELEVKEETPNVDFTTEEVKEVAQEVAEDSAKKALEVQVGENEKLDGETKDRVLDLADKKVDEKVEEKTEEVKEETVVTTEPTDDEVDAIAEGFLKNNFKPNTLNEETTTEDVVKQAVTESVEEDEEVVAVDDELVENMLGLSKSEDTKKD